jgi:UDP-glucose 4-epimerase
VRQENKMKIAILGAAGFIGKHLTRRFVKDGHEVFCFVREFSEEDSFEGAQQIRFNLADISSDAAESLLECDVLVHLVSSTNPGNSVLNPTKDVSDNILGSIHLFEILGENQACKLIFASSGGAVYGIPKSVPTGEAHETNPVSPYGVSKLAIEKFLFSFHAQHNLDYTILRLSNPYGPEQLNLRGQGLIPTIIERGLNGQPLTIWGDGTTERDYLFIDDAVDAFLKALAYTGSERVFNIGSGKGTSILNLVSEIEGLLDRSVDLNFEKSRPSDPLVNVLDVALAKQILGWGPSTPLSEGLQKTVAWNRQRLGN